VVALVFHGNFCEILLIDIGDKDEFFCVLWFLFVLIYIMYVCMCLSMYVRFVTSNNLYD